MAASVYTIQQRDPITGAWGRNVTFPQAKCASAVRKLVNQGQDTCTLTFAGIRPPRLGGYVTGEYLRILRDGVGWFTGRIVAPERTTDGPSESAKLTLYGPWWELQNIVYQQAGLFYGVSAESDAPNTLESTPTGPVLIVGQATLAISYAPTIQLASSVILTQGEEDGVPLDADETISDALAYAISLGARFQVGQIDLSAAIPAEQLTDPTCADVVKRVLRWIPGEICAFDYSTDPPTLNVRGPANRNPQTLLMGGATPQVKTASLQARPDLVLPGVTIQYLRRIEVQTPAVDATATTPAVAASNTTINVLQTETAGPQPVGIGSLVATIELTGGSVSGASSLGSPASGTTFEPTPVGLAAALWAARSTTPYEGRIILAGLDLIPGGNWLGGRVNIAGGDVEWATMAADVQTSEENTANGQTTLTVGPPDHLGASDLAALLKASRLRQYVDPLTSILRINGGSSVPPTTPPPSNTPPAGNKGGTTNPPDDPDPPYESTPIAFTGLIYPYSGTTTKTTNTAKAGFPTPTLSDGPLTTAETVQPGTASQFYCAGGYSRGYNDGTGYEWITSQTTTSGHSEGSLDLSAFSPLNYSYAELRGTAVATDAGGNVISKPYRLPVTQYLGTRQPNFRVYLPGGSALATTYALDKSNGNCSKRESLTMDGGLFLLPRVNNTKPKSGG